jgi:hypothetical protein
MPYRIAGIDVHKKMLAIVVADVEIEDDFHFDRQKVGTTPADLRCMADWLVELVAPRLRHSSAIARCLRGVSDGDTRRRTASAQDDSRTAKSRLPCRTSPGSLEQPGMIGTDFRPWRISAGQRRGGRQGLSPELRLNVRFVPVAPHLDLEPPKRGFLHRRHDVVRAILRHLNE